MPVSHTDRQKAYIFRLKEKGRCLRCPKDAIEDGVLCGTCGKKQQLFQREKTGSKKQKRGNRGRPPKY